MSSIITVKRGVKSISLHYRLVGKRMEECDKTIVHDNLMVVELICKDYLNNFNRPKDKPGKITPIEIVNLEHFDLMFAYHDDRSKGILYLGHFNDGII